MLAATTSLEDRQYTPSELARKTANWAKTMTKVIIAQHNKSGPFWHVVNFLGPNKAESRGIVDLLAIRKNHNEHELPLKRGDLFEMILIQVKGGSAKRPSSDERDRLRTVAKHYGAKTIVLSEWKKGSKARFFKLEADEWGNEIDPATVFGMHEKPAPAGASAAAKKAWLTRRANAESDAKAI